MVPAADGTAPITTTKGKSNESHWQKIKADVVDGGTPQFASSQWQQRSSCGRGSAATLIRIRIRTAVTFVALRTHTRTARACLPPARAFNANSLSSSLCLSVRYFEVVNGILY